MAADDPQIGIIGIARNGLPGRRSVRLFRCVRAKDLQFVCQGIPAVDFWMRKQFFKFRDSRQQPLSCESTQYTNHKRSSFPGAKYLRAGLIDETEGFAQLLDIVVANLCQ